MFSSLQQWAYRFMARRNLSVRRVTRTVSISDEELDVRKLCLLEEVAHARIASRNLVFINMDETAIQYEMVPRSTVEFVGTEAVSVLCGNTTMRVTTALTVCSNGEKLRPFVIFKGAESGRIRRESLTYSTRLRTDLEFTTQKNAWMDAQLMMDWVGK
jgi:hypothetical protein